MGEGGTEISEDAATLDVPAPLDQTEVKPVETPGAFLTGVSIVLKASDGIDADLAAIISDHLLTPTPHANAVANAKAAIVTLASKRAAPTEEQAND